MDREQSQYRPDAGERLGKSELTLLNQDQYKAQLQTLIPQAQRRVWIQTMTFDPDGSFPDLKGMLNNAATRDVDTRFTVDTFHKMFVGDSFYYLPHLSRKKREEIRESKKGRIEALTEMQQNGVEVTVTNPPLNMKERINPGIGRNHRKIAIIDDVAFMGDVHQYIAMDQPGTMTKITDPLLVEGLATVYQSAKDGRQGDNYTIEGNNGTRLLVDAGISGDSLIMKKAKKAIEEAKKSIKITNQHTPDGDFLNSIQEAQEQGVAGTMIVGDHKLLDFPMSWMFDTRSQLLSKKNGITVPLLETPHWVHSNLLLVDEGLPTAQAFMGTRCYSDKLADWATQEVTLQTEDPNFINQIGDHFRRLESRAVQRRSDRTTREIIFSRRLNN